MAFNPFIHDIEVDYGKTKCKMKLIKIAQFDNEGHRLRFHLVNDLTPYDITGMSGRLYCQKTDETIVYQDCVIESDENGLIYCDLTGQAFTALGKTLCELILYGTDNEKLTSSTFSYTVTDSITDEAAIESSSDFSALTNAIARIEEFNLRLGVLANLTTTEKSNIVGAVNELDAEIANKIGTLSGLTTTAKSNVVAAINELDGDIGNKTNLTTTEKGSIVAAINEINGDTGSADGKIGILASLTTTQKSNIVAAINEIDADVGSPASLATTNKSNLVAALNEIRQQLINDIAGIPTQQFPVQTTINIYVSTTGSNSNTGLDAAHPLKTFKAAVDMLPDVIYKDTFIHMAAGTYDETEVVNFMRVTTAADGCVWVVSPEAVDSSHLAVQINAPMWITNLNIVFHYTRLKPTRAGVGIVVGNKTTLVFDYFSMLDAGNVSLDDTNGEAECMGLQAYDSDVKFLGGSTAAYSQPDASNYYSGCIYIVYGRFYSTGAIFKNNTRAIVLEYSIAMIGSPTYSGNAANVTARAYSQVWGETE